jgi:hypothetical protein
MRMRYLGIAIVFLSGLGFGQSVSPKTDQIVTEDGTTLGMIVQLPVRKVFGAVDWCKSKTCRRIDLEINQPGVDAMMKQLRVKPLPSTWYGHRAFVMADSETGNSYDGLIVLRRLHHEIWKQRHNPPQYGARVGFVIH